MKKLFLLAVALLMVGSLLFAAEDPSNSKEAKATISLNLSGAHSVVNVGFIQSMAVQVTDLEKITSAGFEGSTQLTDLNIELDTGSLKTKAGKFAIWYFFNAINSSDSNDGITLKLKVTPFTDVTVGSSAENVGFTLSKDDVKSFGATPSMADEYQITKDSPLEIEIFSSKGVSGVHRGYLSYNVNSFEYADIVALDYDSTLTLSILAP